METRQFASVMSWSSPNVSRVCEREAKGLSSLTVIWDDTCLTLSRDPIVEEWRLGKKEESKSGSKYS